MRNLMISAITALTVLLVPPAAKAEPPSYAWTTIPFGAGGFVDGFVYHPKQANILYARTDIGGMYRYDFGSKSWSPLLDHLGREDAELMGVLSIALDPQSPNKVYALCGEYLNQWARAGAVLRSNDQGKTWQKTELTIKVGGNSDGRGTGERLQVDPSNADILFLGSNQDGLWKSADGGASFSKIETSFTALSFVIFDPFSASKGSSQTLYVGSFDGKGGLFRSSDGGVTFAKVPSTPDQVPQHAVFDRDGSLYVTFAESADKGMVNPSFATGGSVWKLEKTSGKWKNITPPKPTQGDGKFGYSGIDIDPNQPGKVVVSTLDLWWPGDDVYVSPDGGTHWTALGAQSTHDASVYPWLRSYMRGEDKMGHWISDVKINPFNSEEMTYGTGYGLWMSRNLGALGTGQPVKFDFNVNNLEETATLQMVSPTGGATLLAALGDVAGAAWDDISKTPSTGLFLPVNETNLSVDYAGLNPDIVARTVANSPTHGFISLTGGADWTAFGTSPHKPKDALGNWQNAGIVAVSAKGTSMVWAPEKQDAYFSADKGKTWNKSNGWPTGREQALTPVSDKSMDGVFYVFDRASSSVLISVDSGATFKPVIQGIPKIEGWQGVQLAAVPGRVRDLWLAAPYGLLHSPDAEKPMINIKNVDAAWLVSFGKAAKDDGYPAVYLWGQVNGKAGLWRSDDEGKTWLRINDDQHQFGAFRAIAGDPLEYGTVYIAPHGRGLMIGKKP